MQLGCRQLKRKFKEDATTVVGAVSLEAPISLKFYWCSSEAVVIVLGARSIVFVVCFIVLSMAASHSCEALTELLPDPRSQQNPRKSFGAVPSRRKISLVLASFRALLFDWVT